MTSFIALAVIALVAWRVSSKEQRVKVLRMIDLALTAAVEHGREDLARFNSARRARLRWAVSTAVLAALNILVFFWAPISQGGSLPWGASFGPFTSNGQWWRLVTAIFVNRSFFLLLVNVGAVVQVGLTLERLIGSLAFAAAFLTAGVFSGLAALSMYPMGVVSGPAGAIWGLYGVLLVVGMTLWRRRSDLMLPLAAIERIGAIAVIFALTNVFDSAAGGASQLVGLSAGIFFGLVAVRGVATSAMPTRRAAAAGGVALAIAVLCAFPLRGILDVRPEIDRIVNVEHTTAANYQAANDQFRKGRMTAEKLAELIDRSIVPELQAAAARLDELRGVPAEDMPRMADAREFLRLRSESWRLRAQGLRLTAKSVRGATKSDGDTDMAFRQRAQEQYQSTLLALGKADGAERASLDALNRLKQPPPTLDH